MRLPTFSNTEKLHLIGGLLSPFVIAGIYVFKNEELLSSLMTNNSFTYTVSTMFPMAGIAFILVIITSGLLTFLNWARSIRRPSPGSIEPVPVQKESWKKKFVAYYWFLTAAVAVLSLLT